MQYFDKNGKEIKAGMKILMDDGSIEMVYDTDDQYGNPSLGINASNEEFLKLHPNWAREYYNSAKESTLLRRTDSSNHQNKPILTTKVYHKTRFLSI